MVRIEYRVKVLRNGAFLRFIGFDPSKPPSITVRADADIKSSFSGTFLPAQEDADAVDWLKDELQPCIVINGTESPLGVFRPTGLTTSKQNGVTSATVVGYDRNWIVQTHRTEFLLHLSAGTIYIDAIKSLLLECGITLVLADISTAVLPVDREDWPIGTSFLKIINQLLAEIGFEALWFDADGVAHLQKYTTPTATQIVRSYSTRRGLGLLPMNEGYSDKTDIFSAPNVFIAICDNADRSAVLTASAENASFGAKSILQRGMRIAQAEKVTQIADQDSLQTYVDKLRDESLMSTREISFNIPVEAGHGVGDIVSIDHPDIGGIYKETGWSLSLTAGAQMKITAKRTVIL